MDRRIPVAGCDNFMHMHVSGVLIPAYHGRVPIIHFSPLAPPPRAPASATCIDGDLCPFALSLDSSVASGDNGVEDRDSRVVFLHAVAGVAGIKAMASEMAVLISFSLGNHGLEAEEEARPLVSRRDCRTGLFEIGVQDFGLYFQSCVTRAYPD